MFVRSTCTAALSTLLVLLGASSAHAGPAPVGLGTAGAFAVLGGSGLTNTGMTTITGDVGSHPTGSQTGFGPCPAPNCVALTGTNQGANAVTQQAKSDLITAYNDAFNRTGGNAVSVLGNGQTLVSGVYTSADNISVNGDLTLDGGGDPNAVFIFQAKTGTLITAAGTTNGIPNTRVLLQNGAQACNVFWQVGSSATISTATQFVGTILALQSITVNTRATLVDGRALARNAAVTLDTNTIRASGCSSPSAGGNAPAGPSGTTTNPDGTITNPDGTTTNPDGTTTSSPAASAAAARRGTARLTAPNGTVTRPFTVAVTGRRIAEVTFFMDGRRVKVVRARPGRTRFVLKVDPRQQSRRRHRVTVRVRFRPSSLTPPRTFRVVYRLPLQGIPPLRFTG